MGRAHSRLKYAEIKTNNYSRKIIVFDKLIARVVIHFCFQHEAAYGMCVCFFVFFEEKLRQIARVSIYKLGTDQTAAALDHVLST